MATLLLRLAAPLQSWGIDSKFETRRTESYPSKSGVVGMLAAALGRRRDADLSDLNALKFGIRIDRDGVPLEDFHIARQNKGSKIDIHVSRRYYLSDAIFLVGLESDNEQFLNDLQYAVSHPVFPLFLGRRSCPPTLPIDLEINKEDLLTALRNHEWLDKNSRKPETAYLRIIADSNSADAAPFRDLPITFSPVYRKYGWRKAEEYDPVIISTDNKEFEATMHDAMEELE